ncbi:uncharacterized protein TM35_000053270 [Trypanosoma theileri]|uniref:Uncharacterized protein n=1 Tax=Trypanosoma theileri TaxID=67003 RepID=A0A1X0P4H0_9TRYP|nr:uncharacterized protein TM35_000053270 [Trypanosoma theileri]ORC91731.1 hypothetical protein TM35_000053270 [Trypanosoma theileri]
MRRIHREKLCNASRFAFLLVLLWVVLVLVTLFLGWSHHASRMAIDGGAAAPAGVGGGSHDCAAASTGLFTPVGIPRVCRMEEPGVMVDLTVPREYNRSQCPVEPAERDDPRLLKFLEFFTRIFKEKFNNLPWWMDEGSLIGVSRAGSIRNADDDFDFFVLLPNSTSPCRPNSLECTREEFNTMIHRFLMPFWEAGACIHWYNPDITKFDADLRLIYAFQLHRHDNSPDRLDCFDTNAPVAHMHLGMLNANGELETNKWVGPRSHPKDKLPLSILLPVCRCRMGLKDAPCPNDIIGFLTLRNRGEYVRRSREGKCLLVKKQWSLEKKMNQVQKVKLLHDCGYASMIQLADSFVESGYRTC